MQLGGGGVGPDADVALEFRRNRLRVTYHRRIIAERNRTRPYGYGVGEIGRAHV